MYQDDPGTLKALDLDIVSSQQTIVLPLSEAGSRNRFGGPKAEGLPPLQRREHFGFSRSPAAGLADVTRVGWCVRSPQVVDHRIIQTFAHHQTGRTKLLYMTGRFGFEM